MWTHPWWIKDTRPYFRSPQEFLLSKYPLRGEFRRSVDNESTERRIRRSVDSWKRCRYFNSPLSELMKKVLKFQFAPQWTHKKGAKISICPSVNSRKVRVSFLVACKQLYKRVCPSIGPSAFMNTTFSSIFEHYCPCPTACDWWPCI